MKKDEKLECKYCGEKIEKEYMKKHEEICDENPKSKNYKKLEGIGGWMVLPIINFCLNIIFLGYDFVYALTSGYVMEPLMMGAIVLDIILISLFSYTLFLLFNKDKKTPLFAIISLWSTVAVGFIFFLIIEDPQFIPNIIFAIVWTAYFKKSKRVKNTFVK